MYMRSIILAGLFSVTAQAAAQNPAAIRGNWIADVDGVRHIYLLIVRDTAVTGTYCVDCNDPANLAFVVDGTLEDNGARFTVFHDPGTGAPYRDRVTAELVDGDLHIERRREGTSAPVVSMVLVRPTLPPPSDIPAPPVRPAYNPPGPPEPITAEKAEGLWIAGTGPRKQYFMIRRVGEQLLGLVCGPCFEPINMAPLDSFVINGNELLFDIVHQDLNGFTQTEPFANKARGLMSRNEMHLFVVPSYEDPETFTPFDMTLIGPVAYQQSTD
jgi:hypothetical protein